MSGVKAHANATAEIIRNFLSLLWRSGSSFDLINLIKHAMSQTKQIKNSTFKISVSDPKIFILYLEILMYKAAF